MPGVCLSGLCSRERHCDRDVAPLFCGFTVLWFGHLTSTSLFPLAPPRCAARLPRYSDSCRVASSNFTDIAVFAPLRRAIFRQWAWAIGHAVSPTANCDDSVVHVLTRQVSLLTTFELLTIPSSTTASPFHHDDLPRYIVVMACRVDPPGRPRGSGDLPVTRSRVRHLLAGSPTGLAESGSHHITDWSFSSGCSPPLLTETQLPLDSGW